MFGFPLLLIPLAICNIIFFLMGDVKLDVVLFALPLMSGETWKVSLGDALLTFSLLLLVLELVRSARTGGKYIMDHLLALVIFAGAAAEFLLLPKFANSTFFLLTVITLVDFLSGLGLRARRARTIREADPEPIVERELSTLEPAQLPVSATPEPRRGFGTQRELTTPPSRVEPIIDAHPAEGDVGPVRPAATPS